MVSVSKSVIIAHLLQCHKEMAVIDAIGGNMGSEFRSKLRLYTASDFANRILGMIGQLESGEVDQIIADR